MTQEWHWTGTIQEAGESFDYYLYKNMVPVAVGNDTAGIDLYPLSSISHDLIEDIISSKIRMVMEIETQDDVVGLIPSCEKVCEMMMKYA